MNADKKSHRIFICVYLRSSAAQPHFWSHFGALRGGRAKPHHFDPPTPRRYTPRPPRRGGRVVECAGFENRSARKGRGSSNLPLSVQLRQNSTSRIAPRLCAKKIAGLSVRECPGFSVPAADSARTGGFAAGRPDPAKSAKSAKPYGQPLRKTMEPAAGRGALQQ